MTSCQVRFTYIQLRLGIDSDIAPLSHSDVPNHCAFVKLSKNNFYHTTTSLKFMTHSLFRLEERECNVTIQILVSLGSACSPFRTKFNEDRNCNAGYSDKQANNCEHLANSNRSNSTVSRH